MKGLRATRSGTTAPDEGGAAGRAGEGIGRDGGRSRRTGATLRRMLALMVALAVTAGMGTAASAGGPVSADGFDGSAVHRSAVEAARAGDHPQSGDGWELLGCSSPTGTCTYPETATASVRIDAALFPPRYCVSWGLYGCQLWADVWTFNWYEPDGSQILPSSCSTFYDPGTGLVASRECSVSLSGRSPGEYRGELCRTNYGSSACAESLLEIYFIITGAGPACGGQPATIIGTPASETLAGTAGDDVIVGLGGNDVIQGKAGNDLICGGDGNDKLNGGPGNDSLNGGSGRDQAVYLTALGPVTVDLAAGTATGFGVDMLTGIENVMGSKSYGDTLRGSDSANVLKGLGGKDTLIGRGGTDTLVGAGGNDRIMGGAGDDRLYGKAGFDRIYGGDGNDLLEGNPGNDTLDGQAGTDTLIGGADTDSCINGETNHPSCETIKML